ncbi:hypothetical protein CHUAL_000022 [Chamberlinius hualienensis]
MFSLTMDVFLDFVSTISGTLRSLDDHIQMTQAQNCYLGNAMNQLSSVVVCLAVAIEGAAPNSVAFCPQ